VPWNLSSADSSDRAVASIAFVIALTALGCGVSAFTGRAVGQRFVLAALLTSLLLFLRAAVAAQDPLWPFGALLFLLVTMCTYGLAFAVGRFFRCGSAME